VCERPGALREALSRYASAFVPGACCPGEAEAVVREVAAIESIAATLKARAAARAAQGETWRRDGHRSAADALAAGTGISRGAAREALETGRRLGSQPELAAAAARGELSAAQVGLLADAGETDPAAGRRLLATARDVSLAELRDEVARVKAAAVTDPDGRRAEIRAGRRLRSWTDPAGVFHLVALGNAEDGAQVTAALEPLRDTIFADARREGRREPLDAYAFDALVELAVGATSAGVAGGEAGGPGAAGGGPGNAPAGGAGGGAGRPRRGAQSKIIVRVDYDSLLRGVVRDGETCEIVGFGPVAVSVVEDLLAAGDPFVTAVLTKARALVGVVHLGRRPNAWQQTALEWLYPSCAVRGCPAKARLQNDHRLDWSATHVTVLDLLDRLCSHHHGLKTRENWELVEGTGKRAFVAPGDPRHPRRGRDRRPEPAATGPPAGGG
jgi:hypothetical protein